MPDTVQALVSKHWITRKNKVDIVPALIELPVQCRKLKTKQEIVTHCDKCYEEENTECHVLGVNESYDQPRQHIKKQSHYFTNKGPSSQSYVFSRSQVWMLELD